jgi:hypothetical protein
VLLVLGLLGGGLVCLLVVNTTLAANSIDIIRLQQQNAAGTERVQELQQQIATERSATRIEGEARRLGLRPDPQLIFIDLRTKSIKAQPGLTAAELAGHPPAGNAGPARSGPGRSGR